jgi:hypothetical protein
MLVLVVGVPLLIGVLPGALARKGAARINIPNRDHWLAPERREDTIRFVRLHVLWFAASVALFLGYVHWLVVQANKLRPPELPTAGITTGLAVFSSFLAAWSSATGPSSWMAGR